MVVRPTGAVVVKTDGLLVLVLVLVVALGWLEERRQVVPGPSTRCHKPPVLRDARLRRRLTPSLMFALGAGSEGVPV